VARLGRKPVRPGRVTTAVSLGTVGLFVISMSAGMGSWGLGAAGVAMVVIAIALLTTASMRGAEKSFVAGAVHVIKVSEQPVGMEFGRCEMQVMVDAPGHPGQNVVIRDPRVPVAKWPEVGETLPALVAVGDPRRVRIQWERVGARSDGFEESYSDDGLNFFSSDDNNLGPARFGDDAYLGYRDDDPVDLDKRLDVEAPQKLPRRQPSHPEDRFPAGVLEGELLTAPVPGQRVPDREAEFRSAGYDGPDHDSPSYDDAGYANPDHDGPGSDDSPADQVVDISAIDFSELPEPGVESESVLDPVDQLGSPVAAGRGPTVALGDLGARFPSARPGPAGTIHSVGFTLQVADLARSVAFYRDLLGFYEIDSGPENVLLGSGDTRFLLHSDAGLERVVRRTAHLNLEVVDVDGMYIDLKSRGVRFAYPPKVVNSGERLELWAASFKDPDGHGIAIIQWRARVG
jgi:resuscitation-promoting factor RpfA